jgi:hypothetical protein
MDTSTKEISFIKYLSRAIIYAALVETIPRDESVRDRDRGVKIDREESLTLNICYALLENLLEHLGVLQLLLHLGDNIVGQLLLLTLLDLTLIADPRVQDRLSLSSQRSLLFKLVCLGLKLGSLLYFKNRVRLSRSGNSESLAVREDKS